MASQTEQPAPTPTPERRSARRGRVLLGGKLIYGNGLSADCTIRDLTESGAKVMLAGQDLLPKDCHLIVLRDGMAHRAHASWTRHPYVGLTFEASQSLEDDVPAAFRPLRSLWAALSPRTF
jgi:hypothetical protein